MPPHGLHGKPRQGTHSPCPVRPSTSCWEFLQDSSNCGDPLGRLSLLALHPQQKANLFCKKPSNKQTNHPESHRQVQLLGPFLLGTGLCGIPALELSGHRMKAPDAIPLAGAARGCGRCSAWRRHRGVVMLCAAHPCRGMAKSDASESERSSPPPRGQLGEPPEQIVAAHRTLAGLKASLRFRRARGWPV